MVSGIDLRKLVMGSLSPIALLLLVSCGGGGASTPSASDNTTPPPVDNGFKWAGHTWNITTSGMAGNNTGSASNVFVDSNGYLHLKISKSGSSWTCAELFTKDLLGFGTYQWQIEGAIDKLDPNVVLGLFPYGPAQGIGGDGTNEIDIEFARWGNAAWDNGNWTVYPASSSGKKDYTTFTFSLSGTYTTSRFTWSSTGVSYALLSGFQAVDSNTNLIKSWSTTLGNPSVNIPQQPLPLGMNLWLFGGNAPTDGKEVEIIIHSFTKS